MKAFGEAHAASGLIPNERQTISFSPVAFPAPAPYWYIRSSSRSAFAQAAAISFFDLCQDPGCVHPLCNDEGISRCGRTRV
jgi:hypothetical protein